jgi:hypothetical protein
MTSEPRVLWWGLGGAVRRGGTGAARVAAGARAAHALGTAAPRSPLHALLVRMRGRGGGGGARPPRGRSTPRARPGLAGPRPASCGGRRPPSAPGQPRCDHGRRPGAAASPRGGGRGGEEADSDGPAPGRPHSALPHSRSPDAGGLGKLDGGGHGAGGSEGLAVGRCAYAAGARAAGGRRRGLGWRRPPGGRPTVARSALKGSPGRRRAAGSRRPTRASARGRRPLPHTAAPPGAPARHSRRADARPPSPAAAPSGRGRPEARWARARARRCSGAHPRPRCRLAGVTQAGSC